MERAVSLACSSVPLSQGEQQAPAGGLQQELSCAPGFADCAKAEGYAPNFNTRS